MFLSSTKKERQARAEQVKLCQDLAASRIKLPKSQGSLEPMKTEQTRFGVNVRGEEQGMISSVTASEANMVGRTKLSTNTSIFTKYAEDHNMRFYDLTFVDSGTNVGWFTLLMATAGVNVITFEPMEQNLL
jgi:hypothetical protein